MRYWGSGQLEKTTISGNGSKAPPPSPDFNVGLVRFRAAAYYKNGRFFSAPQSRAPSSTLKSGGRGGFVVLVVCATCGRFFRVNRNKISFGLHLLHVSLFSDFEGGVRKQIPVVSFIGTLSHSCDFSVRGCRRNCGERLAICHLVRCSVSMRFIYESCFRCLGILRSLALLMMRVYVPCWGARELLN